MAPSLEQRLVDLLERMLDQRTSEQLDMACALGELRATLEFHAQRLQALEADRGPTSSRTCSPQPPTRPKVSADILLKAGEFLAEHGPLVWRGLRILVRGILWLIPRLATWGGLLWGLGGTVWQWLSPLLQRIAL